ncbi:MAG: PepSY-associated TM helix domain-containing protein [Rhodospirillales bacterium]
MTGSTRKALYRVHSWLGLNLGLLAFVLCLTGTVAVFSPELTWLTEPALRVDPPPPDRRPALSWQKLHDSTQAAYPDARVLRLAAPRGPYWAAGAVVAHGRRDFRRVLIDPYTNTVQGQRSAFNARSFFRILHKQFYIVPSVAGVHGILIVGMLGLVVLISVITGLLSIKRWGQAMVRLRLDRGAGVLWSDLHRFTGTWSLVVAAVLSMTGIWYLAEWGLHQADVLTEDARPTRLSKADLNALPASPVLLDLDRLHTKAVEALPSLQASALVLPRQIGDPVIFHGQADAWLVRDRANHVHLNPYTGAVLSVRRATDLGAFNRWVETADPLHFGTWGGLSARIVWFIAGVLMCGGIWAGIYGAWLRRDTSARTRLVSCRGLCVVLPTLATLGAALHGTLAFGLAQQQRAQILSQSDPSPVPDLSGGFILLIILFIALAIWPAVLWVRLHSRR